MIFKFQIIASLLMNTQFQIAIDGPAASGKSTVARILADRLGGYYINTGNMYRSLSWGALQAGVDPKTDPDDLVNLLKNWTLRYVVDENGKLVLLFNDRPVQEEDIRSPEVAAVVSYTAKIPGVRAWLLERQRECADLGIIIMEGRDIGTVIFPEAKYKFFVTASPLERARRRMAQPGEVADGVTLEEVAAQIAERDRIDSTRAVAPLKPAPDAVVVMTDGINQEQVADKILELAKLK